jgi:hypothetical protein
MMEAPSFETAYKSLNKGLVSCWDCENLLLIEKARKVLVNGIENYMCESCYKSYDEE